MTGASPVQRVALVLGASAGGMGTHVRMLATGLSDRGIAVSVTGPSSAGTRFSFSASTAVPFSAVEIGGRPRVSDVASGLRLRGLLLRPAYGESRDALPGEAGPDVVHAHGLRAGALTVLALTLVRARRRPGIVVTVHNAPPAGGGAARLVYRLLERVAARGADLVLCVSPDLERRMRAAGARRVSPAVIAAPDAPPGSAAGSRDSAISSASGPPGLAGPAAAGPVSADSTSGGPAIAGRPPDPPPDPPSAPPPAISAAGRPVVLAAGRLAPQKAFDVLLEAAAAWRDLYPVPLVVIAGEGPLAGDLRAQAGELGVDAVFLGHRDDVPALLAAAAVFVLPSRWEGQPLVLQEALRAGAPAVAARVGGVPGLTGEDAALLVPPGDPRALAIAVRSVLTDAPLAARLRAAATRRAAALPSEADAVTAALDAYAAVARGTRLR
jgi:glycosyltransferase involved in cell wall biosynthesis